MKIIVAIIGGLLGMTLLGVLWALRIAAWCCALATALLLIYALFQFGRPVEMWLTLDKAVLYFGAAVVLNLPTMLLATGDRSRAPGRGVRYRAGRVHRGF
jgi:hypothetical protein